MKYFHNKYFSVQSIKFQSRDFWFLSNLVYSSHTFGILSKNIIAETICQQNFSKDIRCLHLLVTNIPVNSFKNLEEPPCIEHFV